MMLVIPREKNFSENYPQFEHAPSKKRSPALSH